MSPDLEEMYVFMATDAHKMDYYFLLDWQNELTKYLYTNELDSHNV